MLVLFLAQTVCKNVINENDGVAEIVFHTGLRFWGWFCGRFGAKYARNVDLGEIYILEVPKNQKRLREPRDKVL